MRNPFRRKPLQQWQYTLKDVKTQELFYFNDRNNYPVMAEKRILEHYASMGHTCIVIAIGPHE